MLRPILIHPDPRLKKPSLAVDDLDESLRDLADDMLSTMYDAPGIGLAAPQVGVLSRLIVMDCAMPENGETPRPLVMFNPEVLAASDEKNVYEEGCLSFPELFADVTRPEAVDVRWSDRDGNEQTLETDGLLAVCIQHEIDHLDGKLFVDYLSQLKRQRIRKRLLKDQKQRQSEPEAQAAGH